MFLFWVFSEDFSIIIENFSIQNPALDGNCYWSCIVCNLKNNGNAMTVHQQHVHPPIH